MPAPPLHLGAKTGLTTIKLRGSAGIQLRNVMIEVQGHRTRPGHTRDWTPALGSTRHAKGLKLPALGAAETPDLRSLYWVISGHGTMVIDDGMGDLIPASSKAVADFKMMAHLDDDGALSISVGHIGMDVQFSIGVGPTETPYALLKGRVNSTFPWHAVGRCKVVVSPQPESTCLVSSKFEG